MRTLCCCLLLLGGVRATADAAGPPPHLRELLDQLPHAEPYEDIAGSTNSIAAQYSTNKTMEAVVQFYRDRLADAGWSMDQPEVLERFAYFEIENASVTGHIHIDDFSGMPRVARTSRTSVTINLVDASVQHCRTGADPPEDPAARALLDTMIAHYATLESYRDRGGQRTKFSPGHTSTLRFATAFERPDRFRFEFAEDRHNYVVHQSGDEVQTYWTLTREVEQNLPIDRALGGAHGVSGGTASTLAGLLGVIENGRMFTELRDLQLVEERTVQGVPCQGIQGFDRTCNATTLWIGRDDLLLRRIESGSVLPGFTTDETTDYEPEANIPLAAEDLAFDLHGRHAKSPSRFQDVLGFLRGIIGY